MKFENIEDVYNHALLSNEQKNFYRRYEKIHSSRMIMYAPKWLWDDPNKKNQISYMANVLMKLELENTKKSFSKFLKQMFANHMEYRKTETEKGVRWGPKSSQYYDSLFELEVMEFLMYLGHKIDLSLTKLRNGREAECSVLCSNKQVYIEAKNFDFNDLCDDVYGEFEIFERPKKISIEEKKAKKEETDQKILNRFTNQFDKGMSKFSDINESFGLFINVNLPIGLLGEKLLTHINSLFNSNIDDNMKWLCIFSGDKVYCLDNELKSFITYNRNFDL